MRLYFPPSDGPAQRSGAVARPTALPAIPDSVLDRHGARVLRPAEAVRASGAPAPASTVYRSGVLLVPQDLLTGERAALAAFNAALAGEGFTLLAPESVPGAVRGHAASAGALAASHRAAPLAAAGGQPVAVDAWRALTALRAAGQRGDLDASAAGRVRLDHLLVGANIATQGSGDPEPLTLGTPQAALSGRIPVGVMLPAPPRRTLAQLGVGRRPVVAVLDTGYAPHPWLDVVDRSAAVPADEFVVVDSAAQAAIQAGTVAGATRSGMPTEILDGYLDQPAVAQPLVGELDSHAGHGTFIAGLIRQIAPDAQVRAIRVMHPDGVAYESDVLLALALIADETRRAQQGDATARPVDVVCLSLGYFDEGDPTGQATGQLAAAIDTLTGLGVLVVAAAGNHATGREFYPAALSTRPSPGGFPAVVSVGALNPNGSIARFSNEAPWVTLYAPGVALMSTFPAVAGSVNPAETVNGASRRRESLDPDDFGAGFALWSGTSFAAPVAAAMLANLILGQGTALDERDGPAAIRRAGQAWDALQKEWQ
ncbi:S8 family serine peptidase [Rugosimonospora africana]|uniref:Peptidase S8 n=1 Tax=Rugosimonospora africana TaxID=556532 RepID=A0A8J3QV53_9ACTN|nr:S8 family serine peptidase [Rugosimonospora africana]GIH17629.1 peptidase S8 [Rugosimonospora africana]